MASVESYFELETAVAAEVPRRWGPFRRFVVPEGTFAYVAETSTRGGFTVASGGTVRLDGARSVWLLREGRWRLPVRLQGLRSGEDLPFDVDVAFEVEVPPQAVTLRRFFGGRSWPSRADASVVAGRLEPALRETFGTRLTEESVESLYTLSVAEVRAFLRECGEEVFFERGLDLLGVASVAVASADYEELRDRELELRLEEERVRQRLRFLDLWKRQEIGERLAGREVEAMVDHLERQGVVRAVEDDLAAQRLREEAQRERRQTEQQLRQLLEQKDLEHKLAIDAQRLDAEIAATQRVSDVLREEGLEGAIFRLDDENLKARLYRLLLEKEMSPEQIRARNAETQAEELSDLGRTLKAAVEEAREVLSRVKEVSQQTLGKDERDPNDDPPARRLLAVAGKHFVELNPAESARRFARVESFGDTDLGYLRSLRRGLVAGGDAYLLGAQHGVYLVPARGGASRRYRLPASRERRGGVNASCVVDNHLFATHSDHGLLRWLLAAGERPADVIVAAASDRESVRGVQAGPGGWIWYTRGGTIRAIDPHSTAEEARFEAGAEVTCFTVDDDQLLAGTADGRLLAWRGFDARPEILLRESDGPVYAVRRVRRGGRSLTLLGAGSRRVVLLGMDGWGDRSLRAPQPITWVSACGRAVYAVDRSAHLLYIWEWASPESAPYEISSRERIVDLLPEPAPETESDAIHLAPPEEIVR